MSLWYLSFASQTDFLGACVVEAHNAESAIQRTRELGINPGGEVLVCVVPPGYEDKLPKNILLDPRNYGPAMKLKDMTPEQEQLVAENTTTVCEDCNK